MWGRHDLAGEFARDEETAVGDDEVFIVEVRHLASWIASYLDTQDATSAHCFSWRDAVGHRGGGTGEDALYKKECPSLGARAASEGTPDLTSDPVM